MSGQVIQGFFVGGGRLAPPTVVPVAAPVQRFVAPGGASPAPGPPAPAFARVGARPVQQRAAPGRPPMMHATPPRAASERMGTTVQRFGGDGSFAIDPAQVGLVRGGGRPLPQAVLAKMEAAFGADFSGVRVHVGPQAARIGALAFTTGNDLYFAPGQYQPDSVKGQQLIGHELAHVIQQRQGRVRAPGSGVAVVQDRMLEAEADRLGMKAASLQPSSANRPPIRLNAVRSFVQRKMRTAIQRMADSESEYSASEEDDYSTGSDMDEEVRIAHAMNLPAWKLGVDAGYDEGWEEGIRKEALDRQPVMPLHVARATVGGAPAARILYFRNNPPNDDIIDEPDLAREAGQEFGYGHGYTEGSAEANRLCGWRRQNYPAIPIARSVTALGYNGGQCVYCNGAASTQVDHVYPVQKHWATIGYLGANLATVNDVNNLVGSCGPCNGAKSNKYLNAWNGHNWAVGQWFPHGPPVGTIPPRRGGVLNPGTW